MHITEIRNDQGGEHRILVDIRLLPVHSPPKIHAQILRIVGGRGVVIPLFAGYGIDSAPQNTHIQSFQRSLAGQGLDKTLRAVFYATDCSQLRGRGPCMVWGPGNPRQAHQSDEFIEVGQLALACRTLVDFFSNC
jgi:acetylornithine deacetylase/succinyl-diaminopimelate desuccinylase-like protein